MPPLVPDEILLKARNYILAKRQYEEAREQGLLDVRTGYYNLQGLMTRFHELASDAARCARPLACLVVSSTDEGRHDGGGEEIPALARHIRKLVRSSDALGRLSHDVLAVLAPGTDEEGAHRLAERIAEHVSAASADADQDEDAAARGGLRIGVYAIPTEETAGISGAAEEVLSRAVRALRTTESNGGGGSRIGSFQL